MGVHKTADKITMDVGTSIWPIICKVKDLFWQNVSYHAFWEHSWLEQTMPRSRFPRIFRLCQSQEGSVADFGKEEEGHMSWNLHLRRNPPDFEIQELAELLTTLSQVNLVSGLDKLQWNSDSKGRFTVKNWYNTLIQQRNYNQQESCLPLQLIWDSQVPARIIFFLWEVNKQAVQTKARLCKMFHDKDPTCSRCSSEVETINRLLLECDFTEQIWEEIAGGFVVQLPHHDTLTSRIKLWSSKRWIQDTTSWFWSKAPSAIWWSIWAHRNAVIFKDQKADRWKL